MILLLRKKAGTDIGRWAAAPSPFCIPEPGCLSLPWDGNPWSILMLVFTKPQIVCGLALKIQFKGVAPVPLSWDPVDTVRRGGVSRCARQAPSLPCPATGWEGSTLNFAELIESAMYLYRATGDPTLLELGRDAVESIEKISKVECGFATVSVSTGPRIGKCLPLPLKSLWNINIGRTLKGVSSVFIL